MANVAYAEKERERERRNEKTLTESSVVSMLPFGRSPTRVVSLKLILTLLAAVDVAAPRCGFVASSKTFKEAIACNCVAFSSTFPAA